MATSEFFVLLLFATIASAFPSRSDPVVLKLDREQRFHYVRDGAGRAQLADSWLRLSDLRRAARYSPDLHNQYHLFTRQNPSVSQPLVYGFESLLLNSNFDSAKRTAVIIHGWTNDATSDINVRLVPAYLAAEDMNVIVVDWGVGAADSNYFVSLYNTIISGGSVARFLLWVNSVTGASAAQYHIAGHSLGGHQAGIASRNMGRQVAYVTSLDPAMPGWTYNPQRFAPDDGLYTEVIHTDSYFYGYPTPLGQVDFYPNGGRDMPGCITNLCDHARVYFYFAESLRSGGFTGVRCASYEQATAGECAGPDTLRMGGVHHKRGATGIYYLQTNRWPPYSQG